MQAICLPGAKPTMSKQWSYDVCCRTYRHNTDRAVVPTDMILTDSAVIPTDILLTVSTVVPTDIILTELSYLQT